jgi:uncharacterized glyoxalase superfamily protein PhnB
MGEDSKPRLRKLVPSLGVSDLRRAIAFYLDFFGFTLVDSWENDAGESVWCWLRSGVTELMLQQLPPDGQITLEPALGQSWVLYLRPVDIDETRQQLLRAGVDVSDIQLTTYGARECFLTDPDGYELWLSVPEQGRGEDDDDDEDDDMRMNRSPEDTEEAGENLPATGHRGRTH